jgi:hypothetical protein
VHPVGVRQHIAARYSKDNKHNHGGHDPHYAHFRFFSVLFILFWHPFLLNFFLTVALTLRRRNTVGNLFVSAYVSLTEPVVPEESIQPDSSP